MSIALPILPIPSLISMIDNIEIKISNVFIAISFLVSSADFTRIMGKASTQAQEYSKNIKEGTGSAQIYADKQKTLQQSIQNTGTASRVAAVGVKALSIAGNMLAGMAIAFAISKVIEGIEYLATASERAIEKTKELQQEISQISSDYQSERQTLEGLREEYDALTSKIGENGAEASLSSDEYERYRDITSEILGITPKLITGWDEESRAISNKNNLLQMSILLNLFVFNWIIFISICDSNSPRFSSFCST